MAKFAKLSASYQVTIPKDVREQLGWRPGEQLAFVPKGHGVLIMRVPEREDLVGIAKGANPEGYRDRNDRY
ncbi:MAG: AbrB/MazE/SpoVT family DNA-binding domain-containing protein [Roseiarcus sp.]